jgi:CDP-4-dehydro-6-deoxyglucose reductase, E1
LVITGNLNLIIKIYNKFMEKQDLENQIKSLVSQYHGIVESEKKFIPGVTKVTTGGAVFTEAERHGLVDVALSMWLTSGKKTQEFEKRFSEYLGVRYTLLTNSGSSANLLAFSALTSAGLGDKRILPGDYFITVAAGFPTTITPALQYGCIPIFVDVNLSNYNILTEDLEKACFIHGRKIKAVILAHSLGIPFDVKAVRKFCDKKGIWLIEDACDALGGTFNGQKLGSFGDISTFSFFPAHQITMGEGGAVVTNNPKLKKYIDSFMSWGKACWCAPGQDGCCGKRHCMQMGDLPFGFDHKYIFEHLGYNLKITEMQAAIGLAQLDKVDEFTNVRRANWEKYHNFFFCKYDHYFKVHVDSFMVSEASYFGFALTIRPEAPFMRSDIIKFLEDNQIQTRMLFGGDLRKHPAFLDWRDVRGNNDVSVGNLPNTQLITTNTFWIGVHQGITDEMTDYVISKFKEFLCQYDQ